MARRRYSRCAARGVRRPHPSMSSAYASLEGAWHQSEGMTRRLAGTGSLPIARFTAFIFPTDPKPMATQAPAAAAGRMAHAHDDAAGETERRCYERHQQAAPPNTPRPHVVGGAAAPPPELVVGAAAAPAVSPVALVVGHQSLSRHVAAAGLAISSSRPGDAAALQEELRLQQAEIAYVSLLLP